MTAYCNYNAGVHEQWLLTGDAGEDFPPYRCVFPSEETARGFLAAAEQFRRNVTGIELSPRHRDRVGASTDRTERSLMTGALS